MYNYDQVYSASLTYFGGNELAANVWVNKYALKDQAGNYYELTPDDMHRRLAKELYRAESKYKTGGDGLSEYGKTRTPLTEDDIFELLRDFRKAIPQGSIMSMLGNKHVVASLSNCVVLPDPIDSFGGILYTDQQLAQVYKRRMGAGINISSLRPKDTPVNNAALTSTGAVSFMERFSNTTREVGQNSRRGALMLIMDCRHPDIEDFITIKLDRKKVTGANVSVFWHDDFMSAVKNNEEYTLRWPVDATTENAQITKVVNARSVWDLACKTAHQSAEPGSIFIDTMRNYSTCNTYDPILSTNPCQPEFAKVKTRNGIVNFSEVGVGDEIWSKEGWTEILYKWETGVKKVYAYFCESSGSIFIGTYDHKILTANNEKIPVSKCYQDSLPIITQKGLDTFDTEVYLGEYKVFDITVDNESHTYWTGGVNASNCSEIGMGNDTCRLLAINMFHAVKNPYTTNAHFNFYEWYKTVYESQRLMDDIVDLELESIERIIDKISNDPEPDFIKQTELQTWQQLYKAGVEGRRVGLGFTSLGDTLAALGYKYDNAETIIDQIMRTKILAEFDASVDMAIERGAFPAFDPTKENSDFVQMLAKEFPNLYDRMIEHGRRGISLSTVAPSGSVSLLAKLVNRFGTTSGIEPVFASWYTRRKKVNPNDDGVKIDFTDDLGDKWQEFKVYHGGLLEWADINQADPESELSPYHKATSADIDWLKRVQVQAIIQKYITHSISSTINLPKTVSTNKVAEIYERAWEMGLKGLTVYVEGSRDGVLITDSKPTYQKRPKTLKSAVHKVKINGDKWLLLIGMLNDKPYELFAIKHSGENIVGNEGTITKVKPKVYNLTVGNYTLEDITKLNSDEEQSMTRMISLSLRSGINLRFIVEQLTKSEGSVVSFAKAVNRVLAKYTDEVVLRCPECDSKEMVSESGCMTCRSCGSSKCN